MVFRNRVALLVPLIVFFLALPSGPRPAAAKPPYPDLSIVPDMITIAPDGSFSCRVVIEGTAGPVPGSYVEIEFSPEATALIAWTVPIPPGADTPVTGPGGGLLFAGSTDANGEVTFHIAGGGCVAQKNNAEPVEPYIAQVRADNILMNEPGVNSPDAVNADGQLPEFLGYSICDPGTATTAVGLADALYHTPSIKTGEEEICTNFTGPDYSDGIGLADAGLLTPYVKGGTTGTCVYTGP
jgi:hypothetical protein